MTENKYAGKKCFVIMPFGKKDVLDGKGTVIDTVDFNQVYDQLIKKAVEELGIVCERCDEIPESGSIHKKMFKGIFEADLAIVDITSLNQNVFYELGVRHALHKYVTVVIQKKTEQPLPFNIRGLGITYYETTSEELMEKARKEIQALIQNGLDKQTIDSIVHDALDDEVRVERKPKIIETQEEKLFDLTNVPGRQIGYITGNIKKIKNVDIWVNSENTNMQMARPFERSISATIRYEGAKKDRAGFIIEDLIAEDLQRIMKGRDATPGKVIPTTSGELARTNKVKRIFHAASVVGQPGQGYTPINNISDCIYEALKLADQDEELAREDLHSILFPLMGTGTTKMSAQEIANNLIDAALAYMEENPSSRINKIYFLAYNAQDLEICRHKFINDPRISTPGEVEDPKA
ncbi:MAG: macro domain-containing protein [Chloroflexi bacterium]|nr:macro domain-containing protein [Chloroflexota bacterium]